MKQGFDISAMIDELEPVQPLHIARGAWLVGAFFVAVAATILMMKGVRVDLKTGDPAPMFLMRAGLLLLLGIGCGWAALSMASPSVGKQGQSWKMAIAAAGLLPLAALIIAITGKGNVAVANLQFGLDCLAFSVTGGMATAIPMVYWLRRGAPTSPERAGWLTGVASGGLGGFAYGFYCPFNDVVYIGLWYSLAVGICAVAGRLVVPKLIRW